MPLADRFLHRDGAWFDIATAERVAVVVHQAGPRRAQIEWAERCAMLAMLRHPLLRPLVDYGAASATTLFEAYAMHPPLEAPAPVLSHVVRHGTRFLEAHGIALSASLAATLLRPLVASPDAPRGPARRAKPSGMFEPVPVRAVRREGGRGDQPRSCAPKKVCPLS